MKVVTHQTIDTQYSADSVEWCPVQGYQDIMLCGTYQLEQRSPDVQNGPEAAASQVRHGRLHLYQLTNRTGIPFLNENVSFNTQGILDIKWCHNLLNSKPCFAVVNSIGQLQVFSVNDDYTFNVMLEQETDIQCLGLSLDWDTMLGHRDIPTIASSDSNGRVHVHKLSGIGLDHVASWKAHDFEVWITAFNQWNINVIFSGGDDCLLKAWDVRTCGTSPILTSKRHSMGVCSIQSNPLREFIVATGSYDEQILLWDSRQMKQPITDLSLGGGVWRIKWQPSTAKHILTATMYNGFHILEDDGTGNLSVRCHYTEHQSIAYGADWCRLPVVTNSHPPTQNIAHLLDLKDTGSQLLKAGCQAVETCQQVENYVQEVPSNTMHLGASEDDFIQNCVSTCSFYDHLLKLWTFSCGNLG